MCITRIGKIVGVAKGMATVEFFDKGSLGDVDISMVGAKAGDFVEVFGNVALSTLSPSEARRRRIAWAEIRSAALKVPLGG